MSIIDSVDGAVTAASPNGVFTPEETETMSFGADPPPPDLTTNSPPPESYPMTATASTMSDQALQDGADPSGSYGTRSRNRTGHRPNYADDKEIDLEIEATGRYPKAGSKKAHHILKINSQPTEPNSRDSSVPHGGFAAINNSAATSNSVAHETDPPKSQISAPASQTSAPAPSKKRKHPGSNNVTANATTTANHIKVRQHGAVSRRFPDSNMVSFEKSGAHLNARGELVTDDGLALAPNGKLSEARDRGSTNNCRRTCILRLRTSRRTILSRTHHGIPPCEQ